MSLCGLLGAVSLAVEDPAIIKGTDLNAWLAVHHTEDRVPSPGCPSFNTFMLPASMELYNFGLMGNNFDPGNGMIEVTLNPCGVPKLHAGLIPGTILNIDLLGLGKASIDQFSCK
jgi:hypothetical protein